MGKPPPECNEESPYNPAEGYAVAYTSQTAPSESRHVAQ